MSDRVFDAAEQLLVALSPVISDEDRYLLGGGVDAGEPADAIEMLLWAAATRGLAVPQDLVDLIRYQVTDGEFEAPADLRVLEYLAVLDTSPWAGVLRRVRALLLGAGLDVSNLDENVGYSEPGLALSDAVADLAAEEVAVPDDLRAAIMSLVAGTFVEREVLDSLAGPGVASP